MKTVQILLLSSTLALSIGSVAQAASYGQNDVAPDAFSATVYDGRSAFVTPDNRTAPSRALPERSLCGLDIATECGQ